MPIGITDEHEALRRAVAGWVERHCPPSVPRSVLDEPVAARPPFWSALAEPGWLGLHVPEALGGSGYGLAETVVVLEELGRAAAPGPFLPTVLAAAVLARAGGGAAAELLPGLTSGASVGAVAFAARLESEALPDGGRRVSGTARPVLSGHLADVLLVQAGDTWVALTEAEFDATELPSTDLTRRVARVDVSGVAVPPARVLSAVDEHLVRDLAAVLFGAEAVGASQWCVNTSAEYARDRRQFDRPIGQFQGVKHRCANMLARTELARAAVWDAARAADASDRRTGTHIAAGEDGAAHGDVARGDGAHGDRALDAFPLTAASVAALTIDAFADTAKDCIQVLGGIGFTWEHDAQLYLRRAIANRALLGPTARWRERAVRLALGGVRRRLTVDLPAEAEPRRAEVRAFLERVQPLDATDGRNLMAAEGYLVPSWPRPWGRGAGALEQLVIDEEFRAARLIRPSLIIGGWALPPLIVYGTPEQQERWIPPTLRGEISWCQLFSEPGAGSDLASLATRAERVDGGWRVNGQKVWTTMARQADWGFLLARTDPDAPKHEGISFFMLDMASPGIEIRPLRELTGEAMFNEVFLTDVFVPEDCLVGKENDGWRATRTSLANERVFMGSGATLDAHMRKLLEMLGDEPQEPWMLDEVGGLVATSYGLAVLGLRLTLLALSGANPSGSEASVRKLLGVEHDQRVQEVGVALLGEDATVWDSERFAWVHRFLYLRSLTIAGGTSEIQRNIIGERVLGLPRDA